MKMNNQQEVEIREFALNLLRDKSSSLVADHLAHSKKRNSKINRKLTTGLTQYHDPKIVIAETLGHTYNSSMGFSMEKIAMFASQYNFERCKKVTGAFFAEQDAAIGVISGANHDKKNPRKPSIADYNEIDDVICNSISTDEIKPCDLVLFDTDTKTHYLVEMKLGGELDSKKAWSEKIALFRQYAVLSSSIKSDESIKIIFGCVYNKNGDDMPWKQDTVTRHFSPDEILIGKDFWNFVTGFDNGWDVIMGAYKKYAVYQDMDKGIIIQSYLNNLK